MAATTKMKVIVRVSLSEVIQYTSSELSAKFDAFIRSVTILGNKCPKQLHYNALTTERSILLESARSI